MNDLRIPRLNKVILSGRITNDIELRFTAKGTPVCRFTLAVDKSVKKEDGSYDNSQASFIECVAWSKWAESLNEKAHKGSPIIVEGHIEARNYVDSNDNKRKAVEIIAEYIQFLEKVESVSPQSEPDPPDVAESATSDDVPF